jgi:hypothetical protein
MREHEQCVMNINEEGEVARALARPPTFFEHALVCAIETMVFVYDVCLHALRKKEFAIYVSNEFY